MRISQSRLYTAILGILLLLVCLIFSFEFTLLFLFIWVLCGYEYFRITFQILQKKWFVRDTVEVVVGSGIFSVLFVLSILGCFSCGNFAWSYSKELSWVVFSFSYFLWFLSIILLWNQVRFMRRKSLGIFYMGLPFTLIILIRWLLGWKMILLLFLGVWSMDIFSYMAGIYFGKHKIAPAISPKKSWEGLIGGLLGSSLCFLTYQYWILHKPLSIFSIASAFLLPLFSFYGDLFESKMKRMAQIKDSSNLLKEHGGIWDRFDSMLFYSVGFSLYLSLYWL